MGFIVGENIHRISAERNKKDRMPVRMEIKVSPTLKSVVKKDANIGGEVKPGVTFEFEFKVDYEEFGEIIVEGGVFFTDTPDKLKKLEKGWILAIWKRSQLRSKLNCQHHCNYQDLLKIKRKLRNQCRRVDYLATTIVAVKVTSGIFLTFSIINSFKLFTDCIST